MSDELCEHTLADVADLVHHKAISPVEVVEATLRRIEQRQPELNAFITVAADDARARASALERRLATSDAVGPLAGIPIALKDVIVTSGIKTTAGSPVLADWTPDYNATVVARLHAADAVVIGKNTLWEFAFGGPHPAFGDARNPWDPARSAGGSSSGSGAAVGGGLCFGALGTDTAGSVRAPAAMCGVVGVKPTYGRISRHGVLPVSYSLDHVAPLARTVRDCALLLQAIGGPDAADPTTSSRPMPDLDATLEDGIRGVRIGVVRADERDELDPQVQAAFDAACAVLRSEGATTTDVVLPETAGAAGVILDCEAADAHRDTLRTRPTDYAPLTRARFEAAQFTPAIDYIRAHRVRQRAIDKTAALFREVDIIALPAVVWAMPARFEPDPDHRTLADDKQVGMPRGISVIRHTSLFNLTGHPALSVPCGLSVEGFPIGLQLAGRFWDEATLLRVARSYERATDWHQQVPR